MAEVRWDAETVLVTAMRVRENNLEKEKIEIKNFIDETAALGLMSCVTSLEQEEEIINWLKGLGFKVKGVAGVGHYKISWGPESVDCEKSDANAHILFEEYD